MVVEICVSIVWRESNVSFDVCDMQNRSILADLEREYGCFIPEIKAPSMGSISLKTLQRICKERIKLFFMLEKVSTSYDPYSSDWIETVFSYLKKDFVDTYRICTEHSYRFRQFKSLHYDRISRFILCHVAVNLKHANITNFIITNEVRLFRLQFLNLSLYRQEEYLVKHKIISPCTSDKRFPNNFSNLYEIHWKYVMPLVATRSVPLIKGKAFINCTHFPIAVSSFQFTNILNFLNKIKIGLNVVKSDPRMEDLINEMETLVQRCIYKLGNVDWCHTIERKTNLSNLDNFSKYFPPCMERIYNKIELTHHLKYYGRDQFIPFLKEIGMSMNDIIEYFNNHSLQIMTEKQVKAKRYEYFIRYQFGLEGRKIESRAKNCLNIQKFSYEGPLGCHGCPLLCAQNVEEILSLPSYTKLSEKDKNFLCSLVKNKLPGDICSKILFLKHSKQINEAIAHPLQYYSISSKRDSVPFGLENSSDDSS